ncbi:MAG: hypothetical protein HY804_02595 [Nitrospinae bacterium]|nr:hypothetical protein [Nitrospinota bacterium]
MTVAGTVFVLYLIALSLITGNHFMGHTYYLLGAEPYLNLVVAFGAAAVIQAGAKRNSRIEGFFLAVVLVSVLTNQIQHYYRDPDPYDFIAAGERLDTVVPKGARIAVNDGGRPVKLYFFHRKGWSQTDAETLDRGLVEGLRAKGLKWLVIHDMDGLMNNASMPRWGVSQFSGATCLSYRWNNR